MYVIVQRGGVRVLCLLMPPTSMPFFSPFCFCFWGCATHFFTAGWHAAWVNRKKVGGKDHREEEMFLTNVTAYQVSMHDTRHVFFVCSHRPQCPLLISCLTHPTLLPAQ